MTAGDRIVTSSGSIANNAYFTIRPTGSDVYILRNLGFGGDVILYYNLGGTLTQVDTTYQGPGNKRGLDLAIDNTNYIQVKNVSGAAIYMVSDSVQWK